MSHGHTRALTNQKQRMGVLHQSCSSFHSSTLLIRIQVYGCCFLVLARSIITRVNIFFSINHVTSSHHAHKSSEIVLCVGKKSQGRREVACKEEQPTVFGPCFCPPRSTYSFCCVCDFVLYAVTERRGWERDTTQSIDAPFLKSRY